MGGIDPARASIIILTQHRIDLLAGCVDSIRSATIQTPHEIVVAFNGTSGADIERARSRIQDVTFLASAVNLGFSGGNNFAARHARGEYLVFLNDDTIVEDGWLDALVDAADRTPSAGAVGSRILFPDETLQEAGSIIWSDGSTCGVGRGASAQSRAFCNRRFVDLCSANALLVRASTFQAAGGFDEAFFPAYYEDVDLCLTIRHRLHRRVLYEPRSRIRHLEAASSEPEIRAALFRRNVERIRMKWERELAEYEPANPRSAAAVDRAIYRATGSSARILIVDDRIPDRGLGSGFVCFEELIADLSETDYAVSFYAVDGAGDDATILFRAGIELLETDDLAGHLARPERRYDVVILSRPHNYERFADDIRRFQPQARFVYHAEALFHRRLFGQAALEPNLFKKARLKLQAERALWFEKRLTSDCDRIVSVSTDEKAWLESTEGPAPIELVVPLSRDTPVGNAGFEDRRDVVFVAGWLPGHLSPNVAALQWFVECVLPHILRELPKTVLRVTGRNPPSVATRLAGPNVEFTGFVQDLDAFYGSARVAIAPIVYGAGVKLKVIEAIEHGVPVVSTKVGAEGLGLLGDAIDVAVDPEEFAGRVVRLLNDRDAWEIRRAEMRRLLDSLGRQRTTWPEVIARALAQEARPVKRRFKPPRLGEAAAAGLIVPWALLVASKMYDFTDQHAWQLFGASSHYFGAIFTRLPRNIGYLFPVALFIVSCFGPGDILLSLLRVPIKERLSRIVFAVCFGLIAWTLAITAAGVAGFLIKPVLYAFLAIALAATAYRAWITLPTLKRTNFEEVRDRWSGVFPIVLVALLGFNLYLALLGALGPEVEYDARWYHLAMALRYAIHGRLYDLVADTHSIIFGFPQYQETLYAAMIVMFGLPAAKVLSWTGLLLTIGAIFVFALEFYRRPVLGLLASLLFVSTPIVAWSASTASNDLAQAPFTALAIFAFLRWKDQRRFSWLAVSGMLCGYGLSIKPFSVALALVLGALVVAITLWEASHSANNDGKVNVARGIRQAAWTLVPFALGAFLVAVPGIVRSTLITGDPLFPIFTSLSHGGRWWWFVKAAAHSPHRSLVDFLTLPWSITFDTIRRRDIIGPVLLLAAPLVLARLLLSRPQRFERWLSAVIILWLGLWYWLAPEARYAESLFPMGALLISSFALQIVPNPSSVVDAGLVRTTFLACLMAATVLNTQLLVPFQRNADHPGNMGLEYVAWSTLYDNAPESDVQLRYVPMLQYLDDHLDPLKDKVFDDARDSVFNVYSDVDLVDGYEWGHTPWTLFSSDAYQHLLQEHIDYAITFESDLPKLAKTPLFAHLRVVHRMAPSPAAGSGQILFHVE